MAGFVLQAHDQLAALNTSGLILPAMHALSSLFVLGTCAVQSVLGYPGTDRAKRDAAILKRSVDTYIQTETPAAWAKLLCNIGPSGCAVPGAASGAVIASPS